MPPLTKSIYGRTPATKDLPKTFFRGAVALLASEKHHALGNQDILRKILDDRIVVAKYNDTVQ